jgi:hypothetical protein
VEDEVAQAVPPVIVRVAGGVIALAGGVVALTGVQALMMLRIRGPLEYVPYLLLVLGLPHLVLGATVLRARAWAAMASIGSTILLTLASGLWAVVSLTHLVFSLYTYASPAVAVAALAFSAIALGPCQRASAARARLREQGMNLGI